MFILQALDKSMTCWEEIRRPHFHESQPDGSIRGGANTPLGGSLPKRSRRLGRKKLFFNSHVFETKASHAVIVDFGCGQHKQTGEGWAPSG